MRGEFLPAGWVPAWLTANSDSKQSLEVWIYGVIIGVASMWRERRRSPSSMLIEGR